MKLKTRLGVTAVVIIIGFVVVLKRYGNIVEKTEILDHSEKNMNENGAPKGVNSVHIDEKGSKEDNYLDSELKRLQIDMKPSEDFQRSWKIAASWVSERQIYPEQHSDLSGILYAMTNAKILSADALPKGTQLKMLLVLEGNQKVVFKQKRYERDFVIEGKPYDGFDRHNGEIASFHLDRVLNFRRSPITVGRVINLRTQILPVATERLKNTFLEENGNLCYYGVCYYCKKEEKACADGDIMEGAVTLWLPEEYSQFEKNRHPYQRTYINGRSAKWETDDNYCNNVVKHKPPYDHGTRLLDVTDASVFDYLIGNADRHHYEIFKNKGPDTMLIMMDNAKSFGNPYWHEQSILAPIKQCCILRNSTWNKLQQLKDGVLRKLLESAMDSDPISPVLHHSHLNAITQRLPHILSAIEHCIEVNGQDKVLVNKWNGVS